MAGMLNSVLMAGQRVSSRVLLRQRECKTVHTTRAPHTVSSQGVGLLPYASPLRLPPPTNESSLVE